MATKTTPTVEIPEVALKARDLFLDSVKQYQQFSLEATQNLVKTVKALPAFELPAAFDTPVFTGVDAIAAYGFDFATDLLSAQRAFADQLVKVLSAAQSA